MKNGTGSLVVVLMMMLANATGASIGKRKFSDLGEVEIQRRLKQLNSRPAVKSINSSNGDIFDCVYIYNQPAFDHPLLRNHTIQMEPSSYPKSLSKGKEASKEGTAATRLWPKTGKCPKNTVPIKRTTREDLLIADLMNKLKGNIPIINGSKYPTDGHEYAIVNAMHGQFTGASARINLWKPTVQIRREFSLAQMWVKSGNSDPISCLEVGWQVYPQGYGNDNNPKLFVYYTGDSYNSGCYNTYCPGFVYVNQEIRLGETLEPTSTYGGVQTDMFVQIWKDLRNGNWWVSVGESNVGYWPSSVVPALSDHATVVQWGGEITNFMRTKHTTTEMGSGHFPEEGFGRAAFFTNLYVIDTTSVPKDPESLHPYITDHNCYNLIPDRSGPLGTFFYYGGPGRNPRCP
ncbi:PREDICTED: uncharacterized protein LOC104817135 [Tarenaya hassleriana]|uniref:uncharacterized protein LOC104817135 n=1 Tax=Tarenaya hassleriana TaxID=28532 RepID=UPI00053C7FDF|nr:PREDICTED: uncharacterized protein LOC104817135 [Tarenaya hassleriana]